MFRLSSQLSRGMRNSAFWVSELVRHNVAVQSQMIDGYLIVDCSGIVLSIYIANIEHRS